MNVQKKIKSRTSGTYVLYTLLAYIRGRKQRKSSMQKLTIAFVISLATASCSHKITTQKASTANTIQWYAYSNNQRYDSAASVFQFSDSMIRLYGDKNGYLMSKTSYRDFECTLEYRWNTEVQYAHGTGKKNSGVMYNIPDTAMDRLWPTGIQFQVKEGATGDFILLENTTLEVRGVTQGPGKSVAVPRLSEQDKPVGAWNTIRIVSQKGHCWQYLNGQLVNEGTNASTQSGRLLLQYEGSPVDFRNITIRQLP